MLNMSDAAKSRCAGQHIVLLLFTRQLTARGKLAQDAHVSVEDVGWHGQAKDVPSNRIHWAVFNDLTSDSVQASEAYWQETILSPLSPIR